MSECIPSLKRRLGIASFLVLLAAPSWSASAPSVPAAKLPLEDIGLFADVFGSIKSYYVEDISDEKLLKNAIQGMVSRLDPHSSFLDAKAFKDMQEHTHGEFGGLGIEVTKDVQGVRVVSPIDDTPAARAGIMAGDIIIKIDGKTTADRTLNQNVKSMRGKPNTKIVLTVARKGVTKPLVFPLTRAIIKIRSVKSKMIPKETLGYIRVSQFQERTTEDFAKAVKDLLKQKATGIVLDLRNNPGGLLNAAIGVSAVFLPPNTEVVSTHGRDPASQRVFHAAAQDYKLEKNAKDALIGLPAASKTIPVVVLVNSASASASEIVSGALQDNKRATIMGTRSFGKGSVQTVIPLRIKGEDTIGIKITTAHYFTPSGRSIQAKGITPNIAVDDTPEGNYPSFNIREADLTGHIENPEKDGKGTDAKTEEIPEEDFDDAEAPKLRYQFGDEKDFPLQQALNHLKGKHVVTHAETTKKQKKSLPKSESKTESKGEPKPNQK